MLKNQIKIFKFIKIKIKGEVMGVKVKCELVGKEMLVEGIYKFSVK